MNHSHLDTDESAYCAVNTSLEPSLISLYFARKIGNACSNFFEMCKQKWKHKIQDKRRVSAIIMSLKVNILVKPPLFVSLNSFRQLYSHFLSSLQLLFSRLWLQIIPHCFNNTKDEALIEANPWLCSIVFFSIHVCF